MATVLGVGKPEWYPRSMLLALVLSVVFPVALHVHYLKLSGGDVGNLAKQQWALFIGTALAYLAQVSLIFAVRVVSVQCLWRAFKTVEMSIGGIDSAFSAMSDPLVFLNKEVWQKTPLATLLALVSWFFPLTTFFAPATLNVETEMRTTFASRDVPVLNINNHDLYQRYAFTIISTEGHRQTFRGPRTIVSRLGAAAATTGNMLTIPRPEINATYTQMFYGPYVQCSNSTSDIRSQVDEMVRRFTSFETPTSSELMALDYFAATPPSANANSSLPIQISNLTDQTGVQYASNQLWVYTRHYRASLDLTAPAEYRYLTCGLFNASHTTTFSWQNGIQNITTQNLTILNAIPYPAIEELSTPESQVTQSYTAVMLSLATQLTGSIAFYKDLKTNRIYSSIRSGIAQTVLIGSSDFNSHFIQNHLFSQQDSNLPAGEAFGEISDQRQQDMDYVRARTLATLISELSQNITISLLSDSLLAHYTKLTVEISRPETIYAYQSQTIAIIYPVAVSVAAVVVALGVFIFHSQKISHDISFSSAVCTTSMIHSLDLNFNERRGGRPLSSETKRVMLYFDNDGHEGSAGFRLVQNRKTGST